MKISVVIPAYNAEQTIGRTLDSVLAQTRAADEIIVIDDGSADATADIIRTYGGKVRLIQQENAGVSVARNAGIEAASGDWIAFLDGDDEWLPDKLKYQSEHLQQRPELTWIYSNFYRKEPAAEQLQLAHVNPNLMNVLVGGAFEDYFRAYVNGAYAWTSVLMIRKDVFGKTGTFEPGMKRAQDNDLWFRIAYQVPRIGYLPEPLAVYHLDTPASSTKINDSVDYMIGLIARHEKLSKQYNRYEAFSPCITQMLQTWIRQYLKEKRFQDTKLLVDRFNRYLPFRFKREIRFRLICPRMTSPVADYLLKFKRTTGKETPGK